METFKELGTAGAVARLYEKSGFTSCNTPFFECSDGYCTCASCLMLEGIDFDLTYFPFKHLGRKAVIKATGELLCVLSSPRTLKVTLGVSSKLDFPEVSQIWEGVVEAAKCYGYRECALDLVPSLTGLSIAVSATGFETKDVALKRPIGKSKDLICISNNPGASFLGEQILQKSRKLDEKQRVRKLEQYRQIVGAHLRPELPAEVISSLSDSTITPSFGYFCSKPLRDVIHRLCSDSGLGAKIYVGKLPLAGGSIDAAKELGIDPVQAALRGGDDNCLLFCIPLNQAKTLRHDFQSWDIIGHLARPEVGAVIVSPEGLEHPL